MYHKAMHHSEAKHCTCEGSVLHHRVQ